MCLLCLLLRSRSSHFLSGCSCRASKLDGTLQETATQYIYLDDFSPFSLPPPPARKSDMASTDINQYLPPLDPVQVHAQLSSLPFVQIDGVVNARDLGGYASATYPGSVTRSSRFFRSGEIFRITDDGKAKIRSLGITKIFDLRSDVELKKFDAPMPVIEGVEIVHVPVYREMVYDQDEIMKTYERFADGGDKVSLALLPSVLCF